MSDKKIHFGWFVAKKRNDNGWARDVMAQMMGSGGGGRNLARIEELETPGGRGTTVGKIAKVLGMTVEDFNKAWQTTPVEEPPKQPQKRPSMARFLTRFSDQTYDAKMAIAIEMDAKALDELRHLFTDAHRKKLLVLQGKDLPMPKRKSKDQKAG